MSLKLLYELQGIDQLRAEKQAALDEVQAALAGDARIAELRARLERIRAARAERNAMLRDAQLAAQQIETRIRDIEERLYGGTISNARDLEAMQTERESLRGRLSAAEDALLERMVAAEEAQDALESVEGALQELEARREAQLPQLRERESALSGELAALNQSRAEIIPSVAPRTLATYETLMASRGGQAVSVADEVRSVCGACRVAFPRSDLRRIKETDAVVQCDNCRRILYLE